MTVSLFLTGRHGQPQNNREGPETGRGLWVPRTPLCQRNPVQTSKSLTQRRTYTPLISDTHCTSVQIWLEVDFILLAVCASRADNAKLTRLFRWHSHELHRALTLSLKLHQSAPAVITLAVCWRHVAFSPINATLCLLAQYKCKWLAWRKSLRSVTPCEWRQSIWGEKVQRCEESNDCECDSVNLRSLHLTVEKSMCDKNLS